jgi:LmbE family N-acetylglucosaminyl deacetylase
MRSARFPDRVGLLSPHPDDAVLSAWSLLGSGTTVITVFAGDPADPTPGHWDAVCGLPSSHEAMRQRRQEDRQALEALDVQIEQLDLVENQYADRASPVAVSEAIMASLPLHCELLVAPAGIGGHPDHLTVRAAAIELARALGIPLELYAELPYAVQHGWPRAVDGHGPGGATDPMAGWTAFLPAEATAMRVIALSPDERRAKRRSAEAYETQWPALNGLGLLELDAFWAYEVRWILKTADC